MPLFRSTSVSTLSLRAFDTTLAAVSGAPLTKCKRPSTPPFRGLVDNPFIYRQPLTRVRTRTRSRSPLYRSPPSSLSDVPLSPTTPTDQHDELDYVFEFEPDPAYHYELGNPPFPLTRMPAVENLDKCLENPSCSKPPMAVSTLPPFSPRTEAQRYAAAHRASIDANSCCSPLLSATRSRATCSSYDADDDGELDDHDGIVWICNRVPLNGEYFRRVDTFRQSIGSALDPIAPKAHAPGKKNRLLMRKLVGAWLDDCSPTSRRKHR
ncbi:uncharacterized protein CcaverHIS019_0100470 [Cutaneotrichosporon cavernicola]|uniref:Uncharacterized protein n=1 Tax=Cutaneotrichosporon cavernicola TaxID=279322 RepID=A0AA48I0L5_9TREE|nr:uncharacterized protein CcaverHIS019_0100470 [Cutaneotrichosporon cavernicola]BEI87329.1 hypothetical protein CcaverHIS019_0100470 [Cutaneotrichosporon cavernicola]BEI95099.1 hypothetical protein CcaverHIS631_0100480 [Cutaneotrichosporon cavernicola]